MRIVAGKYKGRTLNEFSKIGVRPTGDKARESLFNILAFEIAGSSFLDLFAGTGAVGIEAISRGAERVVLNDSSRESIKLIKQNLLKLNENSAQVLERDAISLLAYYNNEFDYIFSDPPYGSNLNEKVVQNSVNALKSGGKLIIEDEVPYSGEVPVGLKITDQRKYGRAIFTFFTKE